MSSLAKGQSVVTADAFSATATAFEPYWDLQHVTKEARKMVYRWMEKKNQPRNGGVLNTFAGVALGIVLAALLAAGQSADKQSKDKKDTNKGIGFILSQDATAEDVGLPVYPGAQRRKDTSDESSALQMGLWGGSSGFKLAVLKLQSDDSPEKVAAFYRKALAKYGQVLDCGNSDSKHEKSSGGQSSKLDCDADHPVDGGFTLKAGTKEKQHVVGVEPNGKHSYIALVFVEAPKFQNKE